MPVADYLQHIHLLEDCAAQRTVVHRLHPLAQLLAVLGFLLTAASFDKYAVAALLPLVVFPMTLIVLGGLPARALVLRALIAAPLVIGLGLFNPLFDRAPMLAVGGITLSGGWISFFSLILRAGLMLIAALTLVAITGIGRLSRALLQLKLPRAFVVQLLLLHRYLSVLGEETARTLRAYALRAPGEHGLRYSAWGALLGQLLLRTIDRAGRIYTAMLCRGFDGEIRLAEKDSFGLKDAAYLLLWLGFFAAVRAFNLPRLIGAFVLEALP